MPGASAGLGRGAYEIPIRSRSVLRVYVESGFDLQLCDEGEETAIFIAGPLAIVTENDPLPAAGAAEPLPLGKILVCGQDLCQTRRLQVMFFPDVWFWVEPQRTPAGVRKPSGSKGVIQVCTPGGEIAIWFGRRLRRTDPASAWASDD